MCILSLCTAAFFFFPLSPQSPAQSEPSNIDVRLFREINDSQSPFKSSFFGITNYSAAPVVVGAPVCMVAYGLSMKNDEVFESGIFAGASEVLTYTIRYVFKVGTERDRPYEALANVYTGHLESSDPYSFPSGHAAGASAFATMLVFRYPNEPLVFVPAFVWAGIVGYGRMYFGLHYSSDILGGAIIRAGSSVLVFKYEEKILPFAYRLFGKKEQGNVSAVVLPSAGGALVNLSVKF